LNPFSMSWIRYSGAIRNSLSSTLTSKLSSSRQCTFSLETLLISDYLDLTMWLPHQEEITGIGILVRRQGLGEDQLSVYRALLQGANPDHPFSLWNLFGDDTSRTAVLAFPAFSRQWSAKPIRDSLECTARRRYVWRFNLRLTSFSDEDALKSVLSSVAQYFPHVTSLNLIIEDRDIHLVSFFCSRIQAHISAHMVVHTHRIPAEYHWPCHWSRSFAR